MATFLLHSNQSIYMYHWFDSITVFKISTRLKLDVSKWDKKKGKAKSSKSIYNGKNINSEISRYERALYNTIDYFKVNRGLSMQNFKLKFKELLSPISIVQVMNKKKFKSYFEELYEEKKALNTCYWKGYGTTLNHLKKFLGNRNPSFDDINAKFYSDFNKYFMKVKLSKNTISNHWKNIKAVMHEAQTQQLHSNNEYLNFKRTREDSDTIYLSEKELDAIYKLKLKGTKALARDYFLVGCYTGLRYSDWDQLNSSIIKDGMATIRATKTGELSTIPIHARVKAILKKYPDRKLPKKISIQKMNEYIKAIGLQAVITENIETRITKGGKIMKSNNPKYKLMSTHTARRTFASILVLKGVSPYLIMRITGHKTLSSFEKYVRIEDLQASVELKDVDFFK